MYPTGCTPREPPPGASPGAIRVQARKTPLRRSRTPVPRQVAGAQAEPNEEHNDPKGHSPRSVVDFGSMPFVSPPSRRRGGDARRSEPETALSF